MLNGSKTFFIATFTLAIFANVCHGSDKLFLPSINLGNTGFNFAAIATGDFNNDGNLDIVWGGEDGLLSVLLGNGVGEFENGGLIDNGARPVFKGLAAVDMNGDGLTDIASVTENGFSILLGTGDGQFTEPVLFSGDFPNLASELVGIDSGDINGDGLDDVVAASDTNIECVLGSTDANFTRFEVFNLAGSSWHRPSVGDFNGDGFDDIATVFNADTFIAAGGKSQNLQLLNQINGVLAIDDFYSGLLASDLNGDQFADIVATGWGINVIHGTVFAYLNDGGGDYSNPSFNDLILFFATDFAVTGDVNGDQHQDIIVYQSVYLGNGDGSFLANVPVPGLSFNKVVEDVNADGFDDLIFISSDNALRVALANGLRRGDINLDGSVDLLDVAPFVEILNLGVFQSEADINCDDAVDTTDIAPFVDLLAGE